jgi:hypothetical protein
LASVCAAHQYIGSGAWIEPFVITMPGRFAGPERVAHTWLDTVEPLRAVQSTGLTIPRPRFSKS